MLASVIVSRLLESASRADLLAACSALSAQEQYDQEEGYAFWPHVKEESGNQCGICTHGARLIANQFGGAVYGYQITPEESEQLIGHDCFGHDFAVVGDFIVDWWAANYPEAIPEPVLTIADGIARGLYKPRREWVLMPAS